MDDVIALSPASFTTDQEVRWCPGCGDYAILKGVRKALAELGRPPHEVVFVSGIGCAARFPYYVESYGFHTIHGRAAAVATGVKLASPDLDVYVVGGDGDFLSIGGNHLVHVLRRNVDVNLILLNNAIYGLTKGQASPTTLVGTPTASTPAGSADQPVNAALLALGSGGRFVARTVDTMQDHLPDMVKRAHQHKGASLLEVYQNCIVYNDDAWHGLHEKKTARDMTIRVVHGQPLTYGANGEHGLRFIAETGRFEILSTAEAGDRITVHDERNFALATALARLPAPTVLGVLYCDPAEDFTAAWGHRAPYRPLARDALQTLLTGENTWVVR
ncbi:MAG: 2-oxoacid:ferredoxin oxidoreductase subunit beta [Rhodospirillaceae bacterium]|nr:2-oxoacid:ferredoxin oxidoreductase subunit beta [Rhodospirillaceae bacterium]